MLPLEPINATALFDDAMDMDVLAPTTPTNGALLRDAFATSSPKKRAFECVSPTCGDDWVRAARPRCDLADLKYEPLTEPATDAIPVEDLLFWLGDAFTNNAAACPCASCCATRATAFPNTRRSRRGRGRGHYLYVPTPRYAGLSAKIPVIALPRIEGLI